MSELSITTSSDPAGAVSLLPVGSHAGRPGIPLTRALTIIGRRPGVHLRLGSRQVSRAHAVLLRDGSAMYVRDLSSRTHTFINGHEKRFATLRNGDQIRIGRFTFRFISTNGVNGSRAPMKLSGMPVPQLIVRDMPPVVLCQPITLIGRGRWCDVIINDPDVSTAHAIVYALNGRRFVRDLQSRTGTYVNGQPVEEAEIRPGDVIGIGDRGLQYIIEAHVPEAQAPSPVLEQPREELAPLPQALLAPPQPPPPAPIEPAIVPAPKARIAAPPEPTISEVEPTSAPPVQALHSAIILPTEIPAPRPVVQSEPEPQPDPEPKPEPEPIDPAQLDPVLPISGRIDSPSLEGSASFSAGIDEHLPVLLDLPEEIPEPEPEPIDPATLQPILPVLARIDTPAIEQWAAFDSAIEQHVPELIELPEEAPEPQPEPIDPATLDPILPVMARIDSPGLTDSADFKPAIDSHLPEALNLPEETPEGIAEPALLPMAAVEVAIVEAAPTQKPAPVRNEATPPVVPAQPAQEPIAVSAPEAQALMESAGPLGILPQRVDVQKQTRLGVGQAKLPLPAGTQKWGPVGLAMVLSNPRLLEPKPALPPARRESTPSQAVRHPRKRWFGLFLTATIAIAAAGVLAWQLIIRLVP